VLSAGLRSSKGASHRILVAVANNELRPLVSTALFLEYEAVLLRAEQRLATGMNETQVHGFLAAFASAAEPVEISIRWRPQLQDPADELILEVAVNGQADRIVTHNVADFESVTARFGIRTATPGHFLQELKRT
jgi:putative PIN family toxin of toxin-antitoxin system